MRKVLVFLIIFICFLLISSSFAFDSSILAELLSKEIKTSVNQKVQIGQIKFIGFEPQKSCIPENIKIREIKRPSSIEFTFNCNARQYRALANYEILTTVYVTQRVLKRGEIIKQEDILEIQQPLSRIPVGAITERNLIIGKTLKKTLAKGLIIKEDYLYPNTPVKKGNVVSVILQSGQVTIMTEGVLKSDAVVGGNAWVRLQTGKEIVGKLIDKDKVRVGL
ncbi:MAG: flagellar basal body P-ring formation chaperone FlgA [Thermodesulfovibrio sp.]|jgi:flagella basal body P-ring formation protein FlgA|uniref:Flagella basal body P-ring formation protein FlgA n=2 Tax=Thermodesulfovibrio TaxID=28261 RepID=A0A2J6WPF7_9BACT|nr:MAG: flagella basal body P-ring formation protein FlgA [Thermodesulfovibrio aggregans]